MILSQSLVKDLEREEGCPYKFHQQWIEKNPLLKIKSEDMDKGSYFEKLAIGSGAIKGEEVQDLPRLASGAKSVDQKRIELQADRCYRMLFNASDPDYLGFRVLNTQLRLEKNGRSGVLDIVAHYKDNSLWVIDLKLTKDLSSDRTKYGWGNDWSEIDLLQLVHYQDLYFDYFGERPIMGLLVFDYSPQMRVEHAKINISNRRHEDKEERFKRAEEVINLYEQKGWIKYPSLNECRTCPLQCDQRKETSDIVKKTIQY